MSIRADKNANSGKVSRTRTASGLNEGSLLCFSKDDTGVDLLELAKSCSTCRGVEDSTGVPLAAVVARGPQFAPFAATEK